MFKKLHLVIASCVALVAFAGLSASAFADEVDPYCAAIGNPTAIDGFTLATPDSNVAHNVSGVVGNAYACGSYLDENWLGFVVGGEGTLYNHADIGVPPGVDIADSNLVPTGSYAGSAVVNIIYVAGGIGWFDDAVPSTVTTDVESNCVNERDNEIVGATPQGEIVSCLKGTNPLGENWSWSTLDANGDLWLTIGPMHGDYGVEPGLTYVDLDLCDYFGNVGSGPCNDSGQYQQKNGDASAPNCNGGAGPQGIYTVTATMENGTVTPEASVCARWVSGGFPTNPRPKVDYPGGGQIGPGPRHPQDISGQLGGG